MSVRRGMAAFAVLTATLMCPRAAQAECFQSQVDYDFALGNLEDIITSQLPNWSVANAWDDVLYQLGPGFTGLDNDNNGIDDDDHFDLLAAIVNGTASSLSGVPSGSVDSVRAAFTANAAKIQTIEFTIPRVQVKVFGITAYDGALTTNSTLTVFGQDIDIPSLWELLNDESPLLKDALVNLVAGYMTIGETNSVAHLQSLLGVVVQRFISDRLPEIIANLRTGAEEPGTRGCSANLNFNATVSGFTLNVIISGCDIDTGVNNFIARMNCTEFTCLSSILGSTGNLNGSGDTNVASYNAAARNRQAWMANESITNPPLQIVGQPLDVSVFENQALNNSVALAGGQDGGSREGKWEFTDPSTLLVTSLLATGVDLSIPNAAIANSGTVTATICDGLWTRRSLIATLTVTAEGEGEGEGEGGVEGEGEGEGEGGVEGEGEGEGGVEGEGEGEGGVEGEGEGEGGVEGEGEGEGGVEGEGEGEGQLELDFAPIYDALVETLSLPTNNDLDFDMICDKEQLACVEAVLEGGVYPAINASFLLNASLFSDSLGGDVISVIPGLDQLFAAWLMLDKANFIAAIFDVCEPCASSFDVNDYDLGQNLALASAIAGCTVPTCGGEGEGEGEGAEGEGEGEGEGAEGEGEGEGAEGEGEGEGQVGIDIDFTPIYQAFVLITEQLTNNDINNDDVCDLEELACFSFILSGGVLADVNNAFVANRAQFGTDIGVEILSAIPNLDALFAAWLMLGHQTYIEGALAACEGCANPFDVNNYDVSQNATVAAATAGCNIPACAGEGEGEGEGAEGEGEGEGAEGEGEGEGAEGEGEGEGAEGEGEGAEGEGEGAEGEGEGEGAEGEGEGEGAEGEGEGEGEGAEGEGEGEGAEGEGEGEGAEGEGEGEGAEGEGEGEGAEGEGEGEGPETGVQTADQDGDFVISLSELLRVIQFYNSLGLHCADNPLDTEDGYVPGPGANQSCVPYDTDYNPQDWVISLSELLRVIQFYNSLGYHYCPEEETEDGFCPGLV